MTRTAQQNGKRSRTKGHQWERDLVRILQAAGIGCRRNIAQAHTARLEGCDVEDTDYWLEAKCGAKPDPVSAYAQAERDRPDHDARPIVVLWKRDRREPMATLALYDAAHRGKPDAYLGGPLVTMTMAAWIETITGTGGE